MSQLAWAHAHETLVWAPKRGARCAFNHDATNSGGHLFVGPLRGYGTTAAARVL